MLYKQLKTEIIEAMKSKDENKLLVLRGVKNACVQMLVAKKRMPTDELEDEEVLAVIKKQAKQRKDSIEMFEKAGDKERVEVENNELKILNSYLPPEISDEELKDLVNKVKNELNTDNKGELIKAVKERANADGAKIAKFVSEVL